MEGGLTLAEKGDKTVSLKTKGTSMRCTVLLGVTMNGEKLTPLVVFKGNPDGRIARNFGGMPSSMRHICQDKAWVDHRVFKNWIDQVWAPFALEKGDKTYLLMDELQFTSWQAVAIRSRDVGQQLTTFLVVIHPSFK